MANNDASAYVTRFNEVTQQMEYAVNGNWVPIAGGPDTGITELTGDVTAGPGSGTQAATLSNTSVTPGAYTSADITVGQDGRIYVAANGTSSAPGGNVNDIQINNGTGGFTGGDEFTYISGAGLTIDSPPSTAFYMKSSVGNNIFLETTTGTTLANIHTVGTDGNVYLDCGSASVGPTFPPPAVDPSVKLGVYSDHSGFLPPVMSTGERDAIVAPVSGLMVYNNTTNKLNVFTGAVWEEVTSA